MPSREHRRSVRWIVGADGSTGSEHALRWSISQARAQSAEIGVVRAWEPHITGVGGLDLPLLMDQAPQAAQAALNALAADIGEQSSSIEWTVEFGNPSSTLLRSADDADLLVVGTRGLGGFKRLLLGSVSHRCATHARVPLAVIPATASLEGRVDRLVVGMDGSPNAEAALRWALEFAQPGTTVHVVGAWEPSPWATDAKLDGEEDLSKPERERFAETIDEISSERVGGEVIIDADFRSANPARALLECASAADLLVVGASGHGRVASAILGSVTTRVLHHAPCPVVVLPRKETIRSVAPPKPAGASGHHRARLNPGAGPSPTPPRLPR